MKSFARRYMRNHGAVAGLVIVLLVVAVAPAAPLLYEESPWMMVADPLIPPFTNADYPFGTDMLGRDITAGLVWARACRCWWGCCPPPWRWASASWSAPSPATVAAASTTR